MPKYKFEIQALEAVEIEADSAEEARLKVVDNLHDGNYDSQLRQNCYVSDGTEVE